MKETFCTVQNLEVDLLPLVRFWYKNYRGKDSERTVRIASLWYGSVEYHPRSEFLLYGYDVDKQEKRQFAMSGIHTSFQVLDYGANRRDLIELICASLSHVQVIVPF